MARIFKKRPKEENGENSFLHKVFTYRCKLKTGNLKKAFYQDLCKGKID